MVNSTGWWSVNPWRIYAYVTPCNVLLLVQSWPSKTQVENTASREFASKSSPPSIHARLFNFHAPVAWWWHLDMYASVHIHKPYMHAALMTRKNVDSDLGNNWISPGILILTGENISGWELIGEYGSDRFNLIGKVELPRTADSTNNDDQFAINLDELLSLMISPDMQKSNLISRVKLIWWE